MNSHIDSVLATLRWYHPDRRVARKPESIDPKPCGTRKETTIIIIMLIVTSAKSLALKWLKWNTMRKNSFALKEDSVNLVREEEVQMCNVTPER